MAHSAMLEHIIFIIHDLQQDAKAYFIILGTVRLNIFSAGRKVPFLRRRRAEKVLAGSSGHFVEEIWLYFSISSKRK